MKPRAARKRAQRSSAPHGTESEPARPGRKGEGERGGDALQAALAMLARRSQPSARIRERITDRFGPDAAERTIARLFELRLIDDGAFAERFVRDRFERAGYGRERIRADLMARGIAVSEIQAAIAAVIDETSERQHATRALQRFRRVRVKRTGSDDPVAERKLRDAAFRHLVGRGFPIALVRDLLVVRAAS